MAVPLLTWDLYNDFVTNPCWHRAVELLQERKDQAIRELRTCPKDEIEGPRKALDNIESLLGLPEVLAQELKEKDNAGS
jgi:hypothetical protein